MAAAVDSQVILESDDGLVDDVIRRVRAQCEAAEAVCRYAERLAGLLSAPKPLPVADLRQLAEGQQRVVGELLEGGAALQSLLNRVSAQDRARVEPELSALGTALAAANDARIRAEAAFSARLEATRRRLGVIARGRRAIGGYAGALTRRALQRSLIDRTR